MADPYSAVERPNFRARSGCWDCQHCVNSDCAFDGHRLHCIRGRQYPAVHPVWTVFDWKSQIGSFLARYASPVREYDCCDGWELRGTKQEGGV